MTQLVRHGALLMTYGSPETLERDDIASYLSRVRGRREADPALVDEFTRRYRLIGGSPLVGITRRQADALADAMGWPVEIGMRYSSPSVATGLRALAVAGATRIAGVILSPQYSPLLMGGYERAIDAAVTAIGDRAPEVAIAGAWHLEPAFIEAIARRVRRDREALAEEGAGPVHIVMTAHSLPRRVAEQEPGYLDQLRETAQAVAAAAGLDGADWTFGWQSAGHEPGEWMTPDFADLMPAIAAGGGRAVLVVPVQFLADHLEILYDIDVGAREQAERVGLRFARIESLNVDAGLIAALASVAGRALGAVPVTS